MIIDEIHKQIPQLADMRIREIRVDKQQRTVFCTLSYPDATSLDRSVRSRIEEIVSSLLPKGYFYSLRIVEDVFSQVSFTRNLTEFIKTRFPVFVNVNKNKINVKIDGRHIDVKINVDAVTEKNLENVEFAEILNDHYKDYTSYAIDFSFVTDESGSSSDLTEQEKLVQLAINKELLKPSRFFHVSGCDPLIGKVISSDPMYISDLRNPADSCVICGTVSGKTCRQAKNNPLLYLCKFALTDASGATISCVVFVNMQITDVQTIMSETGRGEAEAKTLSQKRILANDKKLKEITWLADNSSVVVRGKVAYDLNGQLEMRVYDLCRCKIDPVSPSAQFNRKVADDYILIQPEDCTEYRQINFVDFDSESPLVADRKLAVLHVNSTGFGKVIEDKLYAICAVKVERGHVTQRLFGYVNPEKEIDEHALKACGLAQNKLIFYPTLTEIISDLYKFLYGFELVGNDLTQTLDLLNYYAAPMNYRFANKTVAQNELLDALWNGSALSSTSVNVARLEDLTKKCKVSYNSTVLCRDTALAVAKCIAFLNSKSK